MTRVSITDDIRKELCSLHQDTGVGPQHLLKGNTMRPKGLGSTTIYHWMNGKTVSAKQTHLEFVLNAWRSAERILPVTVEMLAHYHAEIARTGLTPTRFIRVFGAGPDEFSKVLLDTLSAGKRKSIRESHWDFICASLASRNNVQK